MKKARLLILVSLLVFALVYSVGLAQVAEAQQTSSKPNWAVPGTELIYGFSFNDYFPAANVSSKVAQMEQEFEIGIGYYAPDTYWENGVFKFSLISADDKQGTFQVQGGRLDPFSGYDWTSGDVVVWNYVWSNQTWLYPDGTQIGFLPIWVPSAQLSVNPLVTVGSYQAYKVSEFVADTNTTRLRYYQKDTELLLYTVSFSASNPPTRGLTVMGLSVAGYQAVQFGQYTLSVTSNSTISATTYDPATRTLSFSASGLNGTMGYAKVKLPKALCANISNLKVYVDGVETGFGYEFFEVIWESNDYSYWIVTVNYQHSTRNIQILIPEFSSFTLLACVLATVAAIGSSQLRQRRKLTEK